jgi:predicted dehydrogenase
MHESRRIRWAILGTSFISRTMAEAIQSSANAALVAIGTGSLSKSAEKSAAFAKDFSIPTVHESYQAVLDDPNVDAVYIGLANHLHKDWILRCAKAGKHILCEKPLVLDLEEAEEVLAAIKKYKVFCMEALMYRCHPFIQQLQNLINDPEQGIGAIKSIHATYYAHFAHLENPLAGGAIRNLGCYPISLVRLLMNEEPIKIYGQGILSADQTKDNFAMATLMFNNHVMAQVSTSNNANTTWSQFHVVGNKGVLSVKTNPWMPGKENRVVINRNGKEEEYCFTAEKNLYTYQIDFACEHITKGQLVVNEQEEGITWQHSLGNIAVLEQWRKQVHSLVTVEEQTEENSTRHFFTMF